MYEAMTREEALAYADKLGQRYKDADGKVRITLDDKTLQACTAMIEQGLIAATVQGDVKPAIQMQMAALELAYRVGRDSVGKDEQSAMYYANKFGVVGL